MADGRAVIVAHAQTSPFHRKYLRRTCALPRVHQRSALLAILGAILSLMISFTQARRLVKPIVTLQGVVGQVASGDLWARAELRSGDEIEDLARSFNTMADTIMDR